jgi:hypothetical protein
MINIRLGDICVEVLAFNEAEEEFVDNLNVRPSYFQHRLIFLGIKRLALRVHGWRYGPEQILAEHINHTRIHLLRNHLAVVGNIVEKLVQGKALYFFRLHITAGVVEVEDDITLVDFLHE